MVQISETIQKTLSSTKMIDGAPGYRLADIFAAKKIPILGNGSYGVVVEEEDQVFKIFGKEEGGYGAFLAYLKGKSSVLVPNVTKVGNIGPWACVHVERLIEVTEVLDHDDATEMAGYFYYHVLKRMNKLGLYYNPWYGHKPKFPKSAEAIVNKTNMRGMLTKMVDYMAEYNKNKEGEPIRFDLHYGNFMLRKNQDGSFQLVLTDPWA